MFGANKLGAVLQNITNIVQNIHSNITAEHFVADAKYQKILYNLADKLSDPKNPLNQTEKIYVLKQYEADAK